MGRTRGRSRLAPLLILLAAVSVSAAVPSPLERAALDVRTAADRGQWLRAETLSADALKRYGSSDDDAIWEIRVRRAEVLFNLARHAEARQLLEPPLPKRLSRSAIAVHRLLWLIPLSFMAGDPAAGRRSLEEATQIASSSQRSMMPLVLLFSARMDPKTEDATLRKALRAARQEKDVLTELKTSQRLAHNRVLGRQYAEAIHALEPLLKRARELHYEVVEQRIEGTLGWAYRDIGNIDEAAEHIARAEQLAAAAGSVTDHIPWLIQLGNIAYDRGDFATAERYYRKAYNLGAPIRHDQMGFVTANLATIALEAGRYDEARRLNDEAMAFKKKLSQTESIFRSQLLDARIATKRGDYDAARKLAESVAAETRVPAAKWLAQAQLAIIAAEQKRNADADVYFRRAMFTIRDTRAGIDDEQLRISFNRAAVEIVDDYVEFLVSNGRAEDALLVVESIRGQTLEEGLGIRASNERLDPRAVARNSGAAILCYHLGPRRSYVWSVTPDAVTVAKLPSAEKIAAAIDAYVRDLLGPLGTNQRGGADLFWMLVEPSAIRTGNVIVIADGRLNVLNLEALVVPGTKPHYWIEDVTLRSAPSLQIVASASRARKASNSILLIGNAPQADPAYPALRRAGDEVVQVQKRFTNAKVLTGAKATAAAYRAASPEKFDVLHFVAHGEATMKSPLDSAVILAPDPKGYKLFARDIVQQPIAAGLVTISSCYGAGKRTYVGEGLVGLAWAFLHAGAQQVVAAVWEVSDAATPELMDAMYGHIRNGRDVPSALREAKLKLVRSRGVYAKPRFWAPFVIYSGM